VTTFRLTDSTLRDGSHALSHQFTVEEVRAVVRGLAAAGVKVIEVSHGDGLGGSSFSFGFSRCDEASLLKAAVAEASSAKIAVLLLPGIGVKDDLVRAADIGVGVARVATHCTEADISAQHIGLARELGLEAIGFLMMSHMVSPDELLEQAKRMESYGADCVYVVDSAGSMTIDDARARVAALKAGLDTQVGIHAHNNLGLAVGISMGSFDEGVDQIDGCMIGLGAGAGNCPTEVLVAALARRGITAGIDPFSLIELADGVVRPLRPVQGVIDGDALVLGYAGVYGSFHLHAKRASERFGVKTRDILLEAGRRGVIGGQEDMIIDIAVELANRTQGDW